MNIPSIELLYATIEQQQRVIKQAHEDIAKLNSSLDNAGMIIERLTAERDRFANMISESSNRWQDMMAALREAKEAIEYCIIEAGGVCEHDAGVCLCVEFKAIATINKVLGEE